MGWDEDKYTVRLTQEDIDRGYFMVDYQDEGAMRKVTIKRANVGDTWTCWRPRPGCLR